MSKPPRRQAKRGRPKPAPRRASETVKIERIGLQGDGEATLADGTRAFVPFTLPGDEVIVQPREKRGDGYAAEIVERLGGPAHAAPICRYFERCGGCQVQHMPDADYAAWKRRAVETALRRQGIDAPLAPLARVPTASRRRARMAAVMTAGGLVLGFNAARGDTVVDIEACPLFAPALAALMAPLRALLSKILKPAERADVALTALGAGNTDVLIVSAAALDLATREALAGFTEAEDIARIAWQTPKGEPEPIVTRRTVTVDAGGVAVALPSGGFLQPSKEGEDLLRALVSEGVGGARRIADLYCGIGTFALPLAAAGAHVRAIDGAAPLIGALNRAAGQAGLGGRISGEVRDLARQPLTAAELSGLDAVVFDPPRAGAKAQAEAIAAAGTRRVVAVSCNPATLGRDLRVLIDAGYAIQTVVPVDQFPMSHHIEAVAVLVRAG